MAEKKSPGNQAGKTSRRKKAMLWRYIGFLALLSVCIAAMAFTSGHKIPIYIVGGGFWLGLLGTLVMALRINSRRKASPTFQNARQGIGLIRFFSNKWAKIMDTLLIVSVVGFALANVLDWPLPVYFGLFALTVFSFGMHCMLNGSNYQYIRTNVRGEVENEADEL